MKRKSKIETTIAFVKDVLQGAEGGHDFRLCWRSAMNGLCCVLCDSLAPLAKTPTNELRTLSINPGNDLEIPGCSSLFHRTMLMNIYILTLIY